MQFSKIYIYLAVYLLVSACKDKNDENVNRQEIPSYCRVKTLSPNYEIDTIKSKKGYLCVNEKYEDFKQKLCPISLSFNRQMKIKTLELQVENHSTTKYSLYVNNRYSGSYSNNKKIALNKEVTSLRLILHKIEGEMVLNAWDRKYNYTLLRDTFIYTNSDKTLVLKMADTNLIFQPLLRLRPQAKQLADFQNLDFVNKGSRLIVKNKDDNSLSDQTACFYDDNSFFIDFIQVNNNRKIEYHYFLSGKWNVVNKFRNKTKIELDATFTGRTGKNTDYQTFSYQNTVLIDSLNIIRTKDFLNKTMIDLPDWAMVRLKDFNADFVIDLPYSSKNNFTHTKLYDCNECYLLYSTVKDLLKAQKEFKKMGFRLKMLDCYRPYHIQRKLFETFPVPGYVANPVGGSVHNKGSAVDLTLVDANGKELNMGTKFDDLSRKSNHAYTRFPDTILKNRRLLLKIMKANHFKPIRMEWWHYNHRYAKKYPKIDDAFPCK